MKIDRRHLLLGAAALTATACASVPGAAPAGPDAFVSVEGTGFKRNRAPYHYVGTNMWYAAWIGSDGAFGDRGRLTRELDRMQVAGIKNIRLAGSGEDSPLTNSVKPAFRDHSAEYNESLLKGLDVTLAEMARRDMTAVVYLTNFWEWSGGMMTYLYWTNGGQYINMNDPAHPWPAFADFNAQFYQSGEAIRLYHDYIRAVVGRTNTVTGVRYADDPTIMAWQLANEPRPGGSAAVGEPNLPNFYAWVRDTAVLIKSLAPKQLVSTGSEGLKGCLEQEACVVAEHSIPQIDYLTIHIWPLNWSWVDDDDLAGTAAAGEAQVQDYIDRHLTIARQIDKPLVIEEFGYPRDVGYAPSATTTYRDRYYRLIFAAVEKSIREGGPLQGSNFWAWNGEGRAKHADWRFHSGDTAFLGDPPHEPQGWYGVFDSDATTLALVRQHAATISGL